VLETISAPGFIAHDTCKLFRFDSRESIVIRKHTGSDRANNGITSAILQMASSWIADAVAGGCSKRSGAQAGCRWVAIFGQGKLLLRTVEAEQAWSQLRNYVGPRRSCRQSASLGPGQGPRERATLWCCRTHRPCVMPVRMECGEHH